MSARFKRTAVKATLIVCIVLWSVTVSAGPLDEIIAGAKKEGTVFFLGKSAFTSNSMKRLEKEIMEKFGVKLNVQFTPSGSMPKEVGKAIMERKSGATPSQDLETYGPQHVTTGMEADLFEKVNWRSLMPQDVSPEVIVNLPPYGEVGLTYYNSQQGLMYNPKKISAAEVPRTLSALADPKWKGKVGLFNYTSSWATRAKTSGPDKVLATLGDIMRNGAIVGRYADLLNRYLIEEIWMAFTGNSYMKTAQDKGMPAEWQSVDYLDEESRPLMVRKGARHPNAAKLLAVYLAGPAGARFTLEEGGGGNSAYPGNYTYDIRQQAKKQGLPAVSRENFMEFYRSREYNQLRKKIQLILDTGGKS
ncbi:MAG: extracellular solute-binding protein [Desulfobacterales bacterium]|nr:extracellular solute-binding protein [Desulfobacterales bacterium]